MLNWLKKQLLCTACNVVAWSGGGVHKRIDENRELLELLQDRAPDFLVAHPWVVGWIRSNDEFFVEIEGALPVKEGRFYSRTKGTTEVFPRPWPVELKSGHYMTRTGAVVQVPPDQTVATRILPMASRENSCLENVGEREVLAVVRGEMQALRPTTRFTELLYTRDPEELAEISKRTKSGMSLDAAIRDIMETGVCGTLQTG